MKSASTLAGLALCALSLSACEQVKSSSPLSPLVAGPMAGVEITAPRLLEPEQGRKFKPDQQPVRLIVENGSTNSPRPVTLRIEIAADASFASPVFKQEGIAPGGSGQTAFVLPSSLQVGRRYFWRAQAGDGANISPFSEAMQFEVLEPVIIQAPTLTAPVGNQLTSNRRPVLTILNAAKSGPFKTPFLYYFEVATDQAFSQRVVFEEVKEGSFQTSLTTPHDLAGSTTHFWRVRGFDGEVFGPFSIVETFRTPAAPAPPPGGGGGGGGGGADPCGPPYPSNGNAVVDCVAAKFPEKLAAGVSHSEREANMAFLRDRVIETGRCGGMDLAWNLKRGVGPHSIDAIAWRTPGGAVEVVDIGAAYDDTSIPLHLTWGIVSGPPGYDPYPAFTCK
jgi:hypothetical protein